MQKVLLYTLIFSALFPVFGASSQTIPSCADAKLEQNIKDELKKYVVDGDINIPRQLRKAKLLAKYSQNFEPVDLETFTPSDQYHTADLLMDLKINKGLDDKDIALCKNPYKINRENVFIVIYRDEGKVMVEIPNAYSSIGTKDKVSFEY